MDLPGGARDRPLHSQHSAPSRKHLDQAEGKMIGDYRRQGGECLSRSICAACQGSGYAADIPFAFEPSQPVRGVDRPIPVPPLAEVSGVDLLPEVAS